MMPAGDGRGQRGARRPPGGAAGAEGKTYGRALDPRDLEIARLKKELDELRAHARFLRTEVEESHRRFSTLTRASKKFASSMRGSTNERNRQRNRLAAQYIVSRVLTRARDLNEAAPEILAIFGERLGWEVGIHWTVDDDELRCERVWRSPGGFWRSPGRLEETCRQMSFPRGVGLPGRAWARGDAVWVENLLEEEERWEVAESENLRGALAFPVRDGALVGVFGFFRHETLPLDENLLQTAIVIGNQIGQFVERRQAEEERDRAFARERQARRELDGLFESISDAFFAVDGEWRLTYVNRKAEELWSRSRDDLLGKKLWEVFPQPADSTVYREVNRAMEERVTTGFEAFSPLVGLWFSGRAYPTARGISVHFQDVTERKKTEEALRESEEQYRSLFESIDEGFCTIEVLFDENGRPADYRFLEVNPSFGKQTGIYDAVGRRMREIAPQHEEHWFEIYGRVALTGEPIRFESRAEQLHRWYDVYAFRVQEPELRRVAILFKDITERKKAETALRENEEWLRLAERAARSGTWEWNLLSDEIRWSDEHRELFGFAQEGRVTREGWWAAVHPEDLPRLEEAGRRCSEEGGQWPEIEYRILRDGETRWINARGRTARDEEGRPARILGISVDVTERKAAEEERDRLRVLRRVARAEVAERERISRALHDRVAHSMGVAHQSLQLYEVFERSDPAQAAAKLDLAKRMTKTALESTRNLSMELRRSEAEEGLVEALRDLLDVSVPEGIRAELQARGEESRVPPHVRGQLFLILREAVRNAAAHSGAVRITVVLDVTPERVVGSVEDDGRGLPREDGAAADSGVGMRSMRERAALVGGDVVIVSDPGGGTKVEASIPLEEA